MYLDSPTKKVLVERKRLLIDEILAEQAAGIDTYEHLTGVVEPHVTRKRLKRLTLDELYDIYESMT